MNLFSVISELFDKDLSKIYLNSLYTNLKTIRGICKVEVFDLVAVKNRDG